MHVKFYYLIENGTWEYKDEGLQDQTKTGEVTH